MNTAQQKTCEDEGLALQPTVILLAIPVIMTVFWYLGRIGFFRRELADFFTNTPWTPLYPFVYFSMCSMLLRVGVPILLILFLFRKPLREFGFAFRGRPGTARIYLILFLAMLPLVFLASRLEVFQAQYPCWRALTGQTTMALSLFLVYQACYLMIFISGEAFWRGFVLFGLRPRFGYYAIFIMVIPYTMQHYGKPFPESMGAIVTGTVLGWLALRRGNFWMGAALHYLVALSMDIIAALCRGPLLS